MLRLMTLNLWGYEQWDGRKDAVLSLVNRQSPDVIALQEVQLDTKRSPVSQASLLAEKEPYPYTVYVPSFRTERHPRQLSLSGGYSHGLALLSKYPIVSNESYLLSQGAGFDEPCSALFASIKVDGENIDLCNIHFGNTDQESSEHLEELSEVCIARASRPIILGDFNIFDLGKHVGNELLQDYSLSSDELSYISIPKNNGTLDYIVIPKQYSFSSVTCPEDVVSDHRAVCADVEVIRA